MTETRSSSIPWNRYGPVAGEHRPYSESRLERRPSPSTGSFRLGKKEAGFPSGCAAVGQPLKQSREDEPPRGAKKRAVSAYREERNIHVG